MIVGPVDLGLHKRGERPTYEHLKLDSDKIREEYLSKQVLDRKYLHEHLLHSHRICAQEADVAHIRLGQATLLEYDEAMEDLKKITSEGFDVIRKHVLRKTNLPQYMVSMLYENMY